VLYEFPFGDPKLEWREVVPARPFAFSFCDDKGNTDYVQWTVDPITRDVEIVKGDVSKLKDVYNDEQIVKAFHNGRYDIGMIEFLLGALGVRVRGPVIDTMILAHIATAGGELTYAAKPLAKKYLDFPDADEKALESKATKARQQAKKLRWSYATEATGGRDPKKADYWMVKQLFGTDECETYAVGDVERAQLFIQLWRNEISGAALEELFNREHQLFWTLKRMEDRGARVFPHTVRRLKRFYLRYIDKWQQTVVAEGGENLNPNSPQQMGVMFYETRGHRPNYTQTFNKKLGRNNYQLNGDQLLQLAVGYQYEEWVDDKGLTQEQFNKLHAADEGKKPRWTRTQKITRVVPEDRLAKAVLEIRAARQTNSAFLDIYERYWSLEPAWRKDLHPALWELLVDEYGADAPLIHVLHPGYKQTGTITGRLSCSDPNLMQVASETTGRRKADIQSRPREAFGPRPGHYWYLPDYSQIEVWLFAFMSGEQKMQQALLSGHDFHGTIAKQVFGKNADFEENKDYYRKCAKLIMFAKLYGGGADKIAKLIKAKDKIRCSRCKADWDGTKARCSRQCHRRTEPEMVTAREQSAEFIAKYEAELPGVPTFMSRMMTRASREGVIENPYGRRYFFEPDFAYKSVNYLIQGTAADVMKNALVNVDDMLRVDWDDVPKLLLTIHDEIIVEVPERMHSFRLMRDTIAAMQRDQHRLQLPVPLPVEMKMVRPGHRWHQTVKFDKDLRLKAS
jgi:DNA polymerase I-like protein with 3'-5' exonuclease and polymerase domains